MFLVGIKFLVHMHPSYVVIYQSYMYNMWDFYMVRPKGLESMIEDNDSYTHMKDMLASELSTLSQRTNFFIVTQSVLFGALAFAFQNIFPYMFPILLSVIGIVGTIFCILTIFSGRESSQSLIRWRLSMKELEGESEKTPWNTYYRLYNNKHKEKDSIIDNSPLPYMWLFFPWIFCIIWFGVSWYVPMRLIFDETFMIIGGMDYRLYSFVVSGVALLVSLIGIVISFYQYRKWKKDIYKLD
jgi:hypothetical protein